MSTEATSAGRRVCALPKSPRAFWHCFLTSLTVLLVCTVIGTWSALSYVDASAQLARLSERTTGTVTGGSGTTADVTWATSHASVAMTGSPPPAGTRTQIAYDPHNPADAIIPGAGLLADADQARGGVAFAALVALLVVVIDAIWFLRRLRRRPGHPMTVRRIRVQRGLLSRSWLETEPAPGARQRWIPVYWDPVLAELPAPVEVVVHGDPRACTASSPLKQAAYCSTRPPTSPPANPQAAHRQAPATPTSTRWPRPARQESCANSASTPP